MIVLVLLGADPDQSVTGVLLGRQMTGLSILAAYIFLE